MLLDASFEQDLICDEVDDCILDGQFFQSKFKFFDKDGYDLTEYEQHLYGINGFQLHYTLNKWLLAKDWLVKEQILPPQLYIDHCLLFMRCELGPNSLSALSEMSSRNPLITYLLHSKRKWGIDIDINWLHNGKYYEILHLENDSYTYESALEFKSRVENYMATADLEQMALSIISRSSQWAHLHGLKQNDWKARYFGFDLSEETRKSYT